MKSVKKITKHKVDLENRITNLRKEMEITANNYIKLALKESIHFIQANVDTLNWVLDNDK